MDGGQEEPHLREKRERERESVDGEKSSVLVSSSWRLDSVGWGERNSWDSVCGGVNSCGSVWVE